MILEIPGSATALSLSLSLSLFLSLSHSVFLLLLFVYGNEPWLFAWAKHFETLSQ